MVERRRRWLIIWEKDVSLQREDAEMTVLCIEKYISMKRNILQVLVWALLLSSCMHKTEEVIIGRQSPTIENRKFSAEALWAMGRIGDISVAPQTGDVVYSVSYYSVEQNASNTELFVMDKDGGHVRELTHDNIKQSSPQWLRDGRIAYLSNEGGSMQIWSMDKEGRHKKQMTHYEGDIEGFRFSPDGEKLLFVSQIKVGERTVDRYSDLPLASGRIVDDLMYKHWDEWTESAPHPFVGKYDPKKGLVDVVDILAGEPYESPMKPFGGMEQLAWSPDSKQVAYTCRKKVGLAYAISTNSDIYLYDIATGKTVNLTEGMAGYDTNPQFSPDGGKIAWLSMERDGYESDQNRLFVLDLKTGEKTFLSKAFESNVDEFCWRNDGEILFGGCWHALQHLYSIDMNGVVREITDGQYNYALAGIYGDRLYCTRCSMCEAHEIYSLRLDGEERDLKQLSFENQHIYEKVDMGKVEPRWQRTTDGKDMLTWIVYPPHFDSTKVYPTLLYCEGGPQSPVSQFWSYRWNFMRMAAEGYIVVAPNRRGLPGFGNAWNEEISGDYGGQCMRDYFTAIDEFCGEPFVDKAHLGCVGASFGGFSVYWIAGHHEGRFKAFIAHDGIFNIEMQYLETEEKWFANWDMGGAYWEKDNAIAQRTFANSPHKFVDKWDTPILCIHGEKDYRILANQAMAAFDAAKMRGIPAELLIFPDENHWVLKPQNGVLWQRTFTDWLDRWLK